MTAVAPHMETEMDEMQKAVSETPEKVELGAEAAPEGTGPAILKVTGDEIVEESPPLTYIDFFPQCLGCRIEGCDPTYAEFQ